MQAAFDRPREGHAILAAVSAAHTAGLPGDPKTAMRSLARRSCATSLIAAFWSTTFAGPVLAQQEQFAELSESAFPSDAEATEAVVLGDVDGDGDLDLIAGNRGQQNRLYLNDGFGLFAPAPNALPVAFDDTRCLLLGDLDGDGDLDLICGDFDGSRLYRNDGRGVFADVTAGRLPTVPSVRSGLLGDFDGDGDLDVVLATDTHARLLRNDGGATFSDITQTHMPIVGGNQLGVAAGDVDRDGDLDLVIAQHDLVNGLYLNDGSARFSDASTRLPALQEATFAVTLGDVDGDGDLDLLFGNGPWQDRLHLNDGNGYFTDVTATHLPPDADPTRAVRLADIDGDGDLDLLVANFADRTRLCLNDGAGVFTDVPARLPSHHTATRSLAIGDVDGDRDLDLVLGTEQENRLYVNDGQAVFADASPPRLPLGTAWGKILSGDLDGDGDRDLILGGRRLYTNDGRGWFRDDTSGRLSAYGDGRAPALGDVDGDGDLDLLLDDGSQTRLYLNRGDGTFTDATAGRVPGTNVEVWAMALADVDGDGDLDILFGEWQQDRLFLNDGRGTFVDATAGRLPPDADVTFAVAAGDLDGDGDIDLVVGNRFSQSRLYLNGGSGTFTDATAGRLPAFSGETWDVALGDVDADGDLDIVFANATVRGPGQNRLFRNDGRAVFTETPLPVADDDTRSVTLGDIDGDGDLDIVFGNSQQPDRLYLNAGAAFVDVTGRLAPDQGAFNSDVALADVDGDLDSDLIVSQSGQSHVYVNLLRHFDAPGLLRLGRPYALRAYSRYGPAHAIDLAFPYLSLTPVSIPLPPLGTLGIVPELELPPIMVPQPDGVGSIQILVPTVLDLAGRSVFGQAVQVLDPLPSRLTNVTVDLVRR